MCPVHRLVRVGLDGRIDQQEAHVLRLFNLNGSGFSCALNGDGTYIKEQVVDALRRLDHLRGEEVTDHRVHVRVPAGSISGIRNVSC